MSFFYYDVIEEEQRVRRSRDEQFRRDREERLSIEKAMYPERFAKSEESTSKLHQLLNKDQQPPSSPLLRKRPTPGRGKIIELAEYRLKHLR